MPIIDLLQLKQQLLKDFTAEELQSLKPDRVRVSNDLYEVLKAASHHFKPLAEYGNAFDRMMLIRMNEVINKADGGK